MAANNFSLDRLDEVVGSLPAPERELVERIYAISVVDGGVRVPPGMRDWVRQQFGSIETVSQQKIVRVTNKVTGEDVLFSRLRALRPIECKVERNPAATIGDDVKSDLFDDPFHNTPEDTFGRVVGKYCVTASNVAKFDAFHGLVIFNDFSPLDFTREKIDDYIDVALEWARKAREVQPEARYFAFIWNSLWRAGASIGHGHAHVMLAGGRHYARIDRLRQTAVSYRQGYGDSYFKDLFQAHRAAGCAVQKGEVSILAHLTPFKDKEVILMSDELTPSFKGVIYEVLACFRDRLGVTSFNLSLVTPPLAETEESWEGFPVMLRVVDRGDVSERASDVGGMTIYAAGVISSDPFELARQLGQCLG